MELTYQLTEDEFVRAYQDYWLRIRKRYWQLGVDVVGVLSIVLGLVGIFALREHDTGGVLLILVGFWMVGSRRIWWGYFLRRTFRRSPHLQMQCQMNVGNDGVTFTTAQSNEKLLWGVFQKAYETGNAFLLLMSPTSFSIIPKRPFTATELEQFRAALREKSLLLP